MIGFFSPRDLLTEIVRPTLRYLAAAEPRINSPAAERLLLVTAMYESKLAHLRQVRGPARSIWQIEPATFDDIWAWVTWHDTLDAAVARLVLQPWSPRDQYAGNHHLACAVARILYWRIPKALPAADDHAGLGALYKKYYNSPLGKGSADEWTQASDALPSETFA